MDYHQQALKIARDIGDKKGVGNNLVNIGNVYSNLGDYGKALDYHLQALKIDRDIGDKKGEGADLGNIGGVYSELGDYGKALDYYEQALKIQRDIGDKKGVGNNLTNIGTVYSELGNYQKSLDYYEQALKIQRDIGDKKGVGGGLNNIGTLYLELGDYAKSLDYFQQALKIQKDIGDKNGQGGALGNIGLVYSDLGDYAKSLSYYEQALKISEGIGAKPDERRNAGNIGDVHLAQGSLTEAERWYGREGGPIRLGRLALSRKDFQKALELFQSRLKKDETNRVAEFLFADLMGLGQAYEGLEDFSKARDYFQRAVDMVEIQREGLTEAQRTHFYEAKVQGFPRVAAYEGLARVLQKLNNPEAGFKVSESTKARILSEAFAKSGQGTNFRLPQNLLERENELTTKIAGFVKMMEKLFQNKQMDRYKEVEADLKKAKAELSSFVAQLRRKYPEYVAVKYPNPMGAKDIKLESGEALISWFVTETGTLWYVVKDGKVQAGGWIDTPRKDLVKMVQDFRTAFEQVQSLTDLALHDPQKSQKLFRLLLAEPLKHVNQGDHIILVPDGVLGLVPYEALMAEKDPAKYVADAYDIAYAHSGTSLTLSRTLKKGGKTTKPMFVLADPVFDTDDARVKGQGKVAKAPELQVQMMRAITAQGVGGVRGKIVFARLAETGRLALELEKLFPGTTVLTGLAATKEGLDKQPLDRFQQVVFATHGVLDRDVPYLKQPALVLSPFGSKDWLDGYLTLDDVMSLSLSCDTAALTACQTGLGHEVSGEGVMHLGRGFQYAGAKSVLVSLWSVAEESTTVLVEKYFEYLKDGKTPRQALAQARQDVRTMKNGQYDHPFFWGAFILIGG